MLSRLVKENMRSKLVMASTLAALLAGTGMATAQVADNPPGSQFQDQGIREENGFSRSDEQYQVQRGRDYARTPARTHVSPRDHARYERERAQSRD
jgi:hypothetical protein